MTEQSLDDIMSGRGASASSDTQTDNNAANAATTAAAPSGQTTEHVQQRDGQGRFAGKEQATAQGQADNAAAQQPGHVPIQALDAERGKRKETEERYEKKLKELEDRIASLSNPQQATQQAQPVAPPEIFEDPDGYIRHQLTPVQQQMMDMREFVSENMATTAYGADAVNEAKQAIEQVAATPEGQRVIAEMLQSQHPYDALMKWYKKQKAMDEVGDDPEAYFQRRLQEMQAAQQQPQTQTQQPATQAAPLPTDFSGAPSGGPRGGPEYGGPRSLTDIMKR
ncbi:hypothetical protein D3C87_1243640 [compost metagenome]